jgi:hypothetical protein
MISTDIELAVANHFGWRQNIIVPNISWGLLPWGREVDILVIRPSGYADEIEIKISAADIKADMKKHHRRLPRHELLKRWWFAVPENLSGHPDIPADAGILAYRELEHGPIIITKRGAPINKQARKLRPDEIEKVLHLGCMRIWSLKEALKRKSK